MICIRCNAALDPEALAASLYVCPSCGAHLPMPARSRIDQFVDPGSFREYDRHLISEDPLGFVDRKPYGDRIEEAMARTGLREAVITGEARIHGAPCVLVVFEFGFLGGSIGSCVGEKVARAFERAARKRWPVVAVLSSGGARMQEGPLALFQVPKVVAAIGRHARAGLPYLALLGHPTFGGALVSFGSLADLLLAEPGAFIGFVGPRVAEGAFGEGLSEGTHRAEALAEAGLVDAVVPRREQRDFLGRVLQLLERAPIKVTALSTEEAGGEESAWETLQIARHPHRPTALTYLRRISPWFVELRGDRIAEDDPAIVAGLGKIAGRPVVVIAQERGQTEEERAYRRNGLASPAGYRKAVRALRLAGKLGLPVVTFLDTAGAEADHPGIGLALGECLAAMLSVRSATVSVLVGESSGAGAVALGAADRVLMLQHATCSVMVPEGAAAILYRDPGRAGEVAEKLRIRAKDLVALRLVDRVVSEPQGGAHEDPEAAARLLEQAIAQTLQELATVPDRRRLRQRLRRYRKVGVVGSTRRAWILRRLAGLQAVLRLPLRRPVPPAVKEAAP